jgi:hypothetical protein
MRNIVQGTPSTSTSRTDPYGKPSWDRSTGADVRASVTIGVIVATAFGPHTPIVQMPDVRSVNVTDPSSGRWRENQ